MVTTGRNEPCPCGSGRKFKKCCGLVIPVAAALSPGGGRRSCGECTACCDGWLAGTIYGHEMKPGVPCHFVTAGGCSIYERRPESPCRNFVCAWAEQNSPFAAAFRPDLLGVIIIKTAWRGRDAYLLRSAGRDASAELLAWMQRFSETTGRPFFYEAAGEKFGFGPPAFQQEMLDRASRNLPLW